MNLFAVLILGALGGMLRYAFTDMGILGIVVVNLLGTLTLAFLNAASAGRNLPNWVQTGVHVGLIGSFTTFSTFMNDGTHLAYGGPLYAALFFLGTMGGGIAATYLGDYAGKRVQGQRRELTTIARPE